MISRYDHDTPTGIVKCLYVDVKEYRFLAALSESVWYTKGKKRRIPIFISDKRLFIFKLAMGFGKREM